MSYVLGALLYYGYAALFVYVVVSRLGVPVPATPVTLAAGALVATGHLAATWTITTVVLAFLCADGTWYALGQKLGGKVIRILCRVSLQPASCLQDVGASLGRYGATFLLVDKFLPVVGPMSSAAAGQSRMHFGKYLAFDAAGATIWTTTFVIGGELVGKSIEQNGRLVRLSAQLGVAALALAVGGFAAYRLVQRHRLLRGIAAERVPAIELEKRIESGEPLHIVDLRGRQHVDPDRRSLPGAVLRTSGELLADLTAIPLDRYTVLVCNCPGEVGAAQVATTLQDIGFDRVVVLEGGLDGWRRAGLPLVEPGIDRNGASLMQGVEPEKRVG